MSDNGSRGYRDLTEAEFTQRLAKHGWSRVDASDPASFRHPETGLVRQGVYEHVGARPLLRRRATLARLVQVLTHTMRMMDIERRAAERPFALPLVDPRPRVNEAG